jgi:hypothetical protein
MHQFIEEVKRFLKYRIPDIRLKDYLGNKDIVEINQTQKDSSLQIVFHAIDEDSDSHKDKISRFSSKKGVKVIHLWEDLWEFHQEKVQSRLYSQFEKTTRIHGRETIVKSINNEELVAFLSKNHLNVPLKAKYKYGLFKENDLLAVMSFSKSRAIKRDGIAYRSFELLRFCSKLNYTVVGGFSKLLNHFILKLSPDDIMTYVDKDWSDGSAYEQAGFQLEGQLKSMIFYLDLASGERLYPENQVQLPSSKMIQVFNSGSLKYIKYLKEN